MSLSRLILAFWRGLGRVASRRGLIIALAGVSTLLACICIDQVRTNEPVPEVHDEHAYLLAADTFAHGRLTNPPHPLWRSFETFHVLQHPTYQAKYPPGQGLVLALGQVISGRPIVGAWIGASLFLSALCWMLYGYFPPRWAVIGTILAAATMVLGGRPLAWSHAAYWSQSFWGGALAAAGGALVLGALPRIVRSADWRAAIALGLGLTVLALTRPYEGLLLAGCAGAVLAWWFIRSRRCSMGSKLLRVALPAALVLAVGLGWLGVYNQRVTGSAVRLPYMAYRESYQMMPIWSWQEERPEPAGLNKQMADYARWEVFAGRAQSRPLARLTAYLGTLAFEAGPILGMLALVMLPWTLRSRWLMFAGAASVVVFAGQWLSSYYEVHYHAPAAALTVVLATGALRRVSLARRWARPAPLGFALALVLATVGFAGRQWYASSTEPEGLLESWSRSRREIIDKLAEMGGRHVVFVRYPPDHSAHIELVYNGADIDGSRVVWARELEPEQNAKVLDYYRDRSAWLLIVDSDQEPARIRPLGRSKPDAPEAGPTGESAAAPAKSTSSP